jgi:hypothetical protein
MDNRRENDRLTDILRRLDDPLDAIDGAEHVNDVVFAQLLARYVEQARIDPHLTQRPDGLPHLHLQAAQPLEQHGI